MRGLVGAWRLARLHRGRRGLLRSAGGELPGSARRLLEAPCPGVRQEVHTVPFLALDLETTGLDPESDGIVAFGWVAVEGDLLLGSARHRILREARTGGETIHGIVHDLRSEGHELGEVLEEFAEAACGRLLVAHHLPMETGFLAAATAHAWGVNIPFAGVDTLALERRMGQRMGGGQVPDPAVPEEIDGEAGAFRLSAARARYGLGDHRLHDALSDAVAAGELFLAQMKRLEERLGRPPRLGDLL